MDEAGLANGLSNETKKQLLIPKAAVKRIMKLDSDVNQVANDAASRDGARKTRVSHKSPKTRKHAKDSNDRARVSRRERKSV